MRILLSKPLRFIEIGHPETTNLSSILKLIDRGKLKVPEFQRDFRWDLVNVSDLIVTLLKGYPAGVFLFWDVANQKSQDRLNDRIFEGVDEKFKSTNTEALVLDGQQRLTSLYQLFYRNFVTLRGPRNRKFFVNLQKIDDDDSARANGRKENSLVKRTPAVTTV
jgi:uncharacterized protein with ParB-like and HNH nuclease domain